MFNKNQIGIAACIYIGQMVVGFGMGWSAPVIPKLQDPAQTPTGDVISDVEASWVASVLYVGCIIGPYISGWLSNSQGRKLCLFLGGVLSLASFILLAVSSSLVMLYIGRTLLGFGVGIIFVINLVYIGEIASTEVRGVFLTCTGIFSTLGTLVAYSVIPFVSYVLGNAVGIVLSVLYLAGLFLVPESPLFFIMKGEDTKAQEVLTKVGRPNEITDLVSTRTKLELQKQSEKAQWTEIITTKSNRKALLITLTLCILQQASGVIAVTFYTTQIFTLAGLSAAAAINSTIIIGVMQVIASCITPFFVERTGRKPLLLGSTACCFISLGALGTYFLLYSLETPFIEAVPFLPLILLILFFVSYDVGLGIIPATLIGEMFSPNARSIGSSVTVTLGWLFGFGVSSAFGYMLVLGTHWIFWTYSLGCAIAFIFTAAIVPETKGKTLDEIQNILS